MKTCLLCGSSEEKPTDAKSGNQCHDAVPSKLDCRLNRKSAAKPGSFNPEQRDCEADEIESPGSDQEKEQPDDDSYGEQGKSELCHIG